MGALLAQAGRPFVIEHDLAESLGWLEEVDAHELLTRCPFARVAVWHALLSPDGVVGQYNREKWGVEVARDLPDVEDVEPTALDRTSLRGQGPLRWLRLDGQRSDALLHSPPPRHITTGDLSLEDALCLWAGSPPSDIVHGQCALPAPYVYLRGSLPAKHAGECLQGSVFEELLSSASFGSKPYSVSLYASQQGLQTNLHADEHSGFLVQVCGRKRVVLFSKKDARALRCPAWGRPDAAVNRRSWYDDGVPDDPGWSEQPPFQGLCALEVEVGPGEALFIPRGWFHDVLSKSSQTLGLVLRCHDC